MQKGLFSLNRETKSRLQKEKMNYQNSSPTHRGAMAMKKFGDLEHPACSKDLTSSVFDLVPNIETFFAVQLF